MHSQELFDSTQSFVTSGCIGIVVDNTQLSIRETGDQILNYFQTKSNVHISIFWSLYHGYIFRHCRLAAMGT